MRIQIMGSSWTNARSVSREDILRRDQVRRWPQLHLDAPIVPSGLQPREGIEYGCGESDCRDCYRPVTMTITNPTLMLVNVVTLGNKPIIKRETEKAMLVEIEDNFSTWMPKSQVRGFFETSTGVWMVTTPFMVKEKGLGHRSRKAVENDLVDALNSGTGAWL